MCKHGSRKLKSNMVFRKSYGCLPLLFLLLVSCGKDPIGGGEGELREVVLAMDTKAALTEFNHSDFGTFKTLRTVLLDQVAPWKMSAEGTYCNIYTHPDAAVGMKWYHPIRCNAEGLALTDNAAPINSWASPSANTYLANGSIPEYTFGSSAEDTWGNSNSALWAPDAMTGAVEQDYMRYWLMAVSPARALTRFRKVGTSDLPDNYRNGVKMARGENLLFSDAIPVFLRGTYLSDQGTGSHLYVYGLDGTTPALSMHENHSMLNVKVYVDAALGSVTLSKVVLDNYIKEAVYMPVDERTGTPNWEYNWVDGSGEHNGLYQHLSGDAWDFDGSSSCFKLTSRTLLEYADASGNPNAPISAIENFYILSQDYSELDNGSPAHPQPTVKIIFYSEGGEEMPVALPLSWNFEPMHTYTLTIRIATWHFYVYIQGAPFDEEVKEFVFGDDPDLVFTIGDGNWETGNGGGQTGTI